jgi:para-nitrobenzyl esterase
MSRMVETTQGVVAGLRFDGVTTFKGIRYAAPPIGSQRFAPPCAPVPWTGELECHDYGAISLQPLDPLSVLIPGCESNFYWPGAVQSEDCLNLNIWTADTGTSKPVMVWIHGGGWLTGSGSGLWSDGAEFAKVHDVVVVSINYRLGALGYLALADPSRESGWTTNNGLLDQVAALQWVKENISSFGGDSKRVCVFGESAGAMSVVALLGMPSAGGLFSTAIVQSGHHGVFRNMDRSMEITKDCQSHFGVSEKNALTRLRELDALDIVSTQRMWTTGNQLPFTMVVDGVDLPTHPLGAIEMGSAASVPLIIGTNTDENNLFEVLGAGPGVLAGTFSNRVDALFSPDVSPADRAVLEDELLRLYSATAPDSDVEQEMGNDRIWRAPVRELIDTYGLAGGTVYSYEFGFSSPVRGGELGAAHAMEIPFVFGNLGQPGVNEFAGDDLSLGSVAHSISKEMNAAWAAFARTHVPSTGSGEAWAPSSTPSHGQMFFSDVSSMRDDPHSEKVAWWLSHKDLTNAPLVF